jgi:UDP-glucuronate 4-epimerase
MNILVTGACGFIGFHLANRLCNNKKYTVYGVDSLNKYYSIRLKKIRLEILKKNKNFKFIKIDISNYLKFKKFFLKKKIDILYHLAGQPGVMYSYKNPNSYIKNNILATKNILKCLQLNDLWSKFIFASSSSVYGERKKYPISESSNLKPINFYAKTKMECEKMILNSKIDNKKFFIFRFFTVYGELSRPDMFVSKYLKSLKLNTKINLYHFGKHFRDFTFIKDVTWILIKSISLSYCDKKRIFNICASKPIQMLKLVSIINSKLKLRTEINLLPKRRGEILKTYGSNAYLKKVFKIKKFTDISKGLNKTISAFLKYGF